MKNISRIFAFLLVSFAVFAGCREEQPLEPVMLELDRTNMRMRVGQSQQLNARLQGSTDKLVWTTADESVAEVEKNGLVTAVGPGQTVITVTAGNVSESCNVEVTEFKADELQLNADIKDNALVLTTGDEYQIEPRFYKDGEKVNDMVYPSYSVDNVVPAREGESVATVDPEGLVKATAPGTVEITVSGAGIRNTFMLTVKELSLDKTSLNLYLQETATITATVLPSGLPDSESAVEWYSSDKEAVSVDDSGHIKALKVTEAPVEIFAFANRVSAVCMVTVTEYVAHSVAFTDLDEKVRKNGDIYEMYVGDSPVVLSTSFKDNQGTDVSHMVIDRAFASSDKSVATVSSEGVLEVAGPGNTRISVSGAGVETSFELTVVQGVESLSVTPSELKTVYEGDEPFTIAATVLPENASVKDVTFTSDKPSVASVDPVTGLVTIGSEGVARITVSTKGFKRPVKDAEGNYSFENLTSTLIVNVQKKEVEVATVTIHAEGIVDGVLVVEKGAVVQLTALAEPAEFTGTCSWMVTDGIVSVDDDGKLTALATGTTTVVLVAVTPDGQTATAELPVTVTGINPTSIEIVNGEGLKAAVNETPIVLEARATAPSNADFAGVNWYSSDEKIVKVDESGRLTYVGLGKATVTAKAKTWDGSEELPDVKDEFALEILNTAVTDFDIICVEGGIYHSGVQYLEEGETLRLECVTTPTGAVPNTVVWKSSMSDAAVVSADGIVTGIKTPYETGVDVSIICTVDGSIERTFNLKVIRIQPKDIVVTLPDRPLKVGEAWDLNPTVIPESLGLYPSNSFQSQVNASGVFVSYYPGDINFGFYVSNTHSESIIRTLQRYYTITVEPYWVTEVTLPDKFEMTAGSSSILTPSFKSDVEGMAPTYTDLIWTSSAPDIVSVDAKTGEVVAHKEGTAEIKATTSHDYAVPSGQAHKSAVCVVNVKQPEVELNVGDYYYSDGTWSSELDPSKTVVGVVFAKVNVAAVDSHLASDYPNCTRGLVVSTSQYVTPFASEHQWGRSDLLSWMNANGFTHMEDKEKYCGYGNTKGFLAINQADVISYDELIRLDICNVVTQHRASVKVPEDASDWFIPAYQEMMLLYNNLDKINASLKNAGGTAINKTYSISYTRSDGKTMTSTKGQQYYYSNVGWNQITSFDMNTASEVQPSLYKDGDAFAAASYGEKTPLPVRVILAF